MTEIRKRADESRNAFWKSVKVFEVAVIATCVLFFAFSSLGLPSRCVGSIVIAFALNLLCVGGSLEFAKSSREMCDNLHVVPCDAFDARNEIVYKLALRYFRFSVFTVCVVVLIFAFIAK